MLCDGWRWVQFGDVVRQVKETSNDPSAAGLERVVGLEHLGSESLSVERWSELADLPNGTSFSRVFRAGQVLFGKRRAYQRKVGVADFDGVCSSDILVFQTATDEVLPEFLPYLVQSDGFFTHALGTSAGSLSPRTKWQELAKYEFPLPPASQQEEATRVLRAVDEVLQLTNRCVRSAHDLMAAILGDLLASCSGGPALPCDAIADVQVGKKLSPDKRMGVRPRQTLRAVNLRLDGLDLTDVNEMDFTELEDEALSICAGDILLVEGGNRDSVGAPTWISETPDPPLFIQNTIVRLRAHPDAPLLPRFLYWAWRAMYAARDLERVAVGTKLYHLGPKRVAQQLVPVPSAEAQDCWVHRLDALASVHRALLMQVRDTGFLRSRLLHQLLEVDGHVQ